MRIFKINILTFKNVARFFINLKSLVIFFLCYLVNLVKTSFSVKDLVLLGILSITYLHEFFPEKVKIDLFLFVEHERSLIFTIFMTGVYIKMIIMSFFIWKPYGINRDIPLLILICSVLDLAHWVLFSGLGFWQLKIILAFLLYCLIKRV